MAARSSRRRATLADVARVAEVSKATASKALNQRDDVAESTRERVLAAVADLDYRPPAPAPAPPGRSALAVVFDIPASPYIMNVLQGVLATAHAAHADLLTCLAPSREARVRRVTARNWIGGLREAEVGGIVGLTLSEPDALIDAATEAGMPFVMVDPVDSSHERMVSIGASNWAGARNATEHLVALGHRRIGWIGGPETSGPARHRLEGYRAALVAAGIEFDPDLVRAGRFAVDAGARHARELLALPSPPTALIGCDDELAVGALAAAHESGLRIPGQLSVVGFDDTPQAAWTTPRLTTVHQPLTSMGRMAVETVLAMVAGAPAPARRLELTTSLTLRETTAPPTMATMAGEAS